MPDLSFEVEAVTAVPFAAVPSIAFRIRAANSGSEVIQTVVLRCQIQIEPARRRYTAQDQKRLSDLFGEVSRWGQTLRPMLWTHAIAVIPSFQGSIASELSVPCTFDFNVAATKYFYGLEEGAVPVCLQFSGTVFYLNDGGALQTAPLSWNQEARVDLPVQVWKDMMDAHYPATAWLCLRRDVFDRLYRYKVDNMIPTWEEAMEQFSLAATGTAH